MIKFMKRRACAGTLFLLAGIQVLHAQEQPDKAVNQQDEVITLHMNANQSADDVLRILRSDNKAETNEYVSKVVELKNTSTYEMLKVVQRILQPEKGTVRGLTTKPTDGSASRYFLVVTTTPKNMPSILAAIERIDVHGLVNSQGSTRRAVRLKYRLASEMAEVLANTRLDSFSEIFPDDQTNTLYFDDSAYVVTAAEEYLEFYDVPTPQVEFDVQVIEVRDDDAKKLGADWDAWKQSIGGQIDFTANQFEGGETFGRIDGLLTLDATVLANFLNYTVQKGTSRLLQRSRLSASNLEPAVIMDKRRVSFYGYDRSEPSAKVVTESGVRLDGDESSSPETRPVTIVPSVQNVKELISSSEVGMVLVMQPMIAMESVRAEIEVAVNTLSGFDEQDRPLITEQSLSNQFTLHDGEKILLGTLERETTVDSERGIPLLKDIPWLGWLFKVNSSRAESSRLFILATPTFSHVGYGATTLKQIKESPVIEVGNHSVVLDDGGMDALEADVQ